MSTHPSRRVFLKSGAGIALGAPALLNSAAFAQDTTAADAELTRVETARRILLKGGVVLTLDPELGDFAQADLLIEDGRIAEIRPEIAVSDEAIVVVDAANRILIPGFVDTAVFDNAREGARHLREDPENPYRDTMFVLDDLAKKNLKNALSPADVARVILRAATEPRPKERYYAPISALLQSVFLGLLPARWVDSILSRVYQIK